MREIEKPLRKIGNRKHKKKENTGSVTSAPLAGCKESVFESNRNPACEHVLVAID